MTNLTKAALLMASIGLAACASSNDRTPASSRAGRPYQEARPMNHRSTDTESLYQACLRERSEVSCRNRVGR